MSNCPSEILQADSYWLTFYRAGVITLEEAERRASGTLRIKAAYETDAWYARKAKRDPEFWSKFYASRINS